MYKNKTFLAIIPARKESKRLPRKNILLLNGKPLISWTIEAAKKSKYIDNIIVNSDDQKILELAKKEGVKFIKRPASLSSDHTSTVDVVIHTLQNIEKKYDYIILLQPTSPLRNEKHIDEAIELLEQKNADAIIAVTEVDHPIQWCGTIPECLSLEKFIDKKYLTKRSQDLEKHYRINGALYICNINKFLIQKSCFLEKNIYAYIMDRESSIDIDTNLDFQLAEIIMKNFNIKVYHDPSS